VQALLTSPEKIAVAMAIFDKLGLVDSQMIRVLLANGGRHAIRDFLETPQDLATALQSLASACGFQESSMIGLLTRGSALAVQALLTSPEKITGAVAVFSENEQADSTIIAQKLLRIMTDGSPSIVDILLESQEKLSNSIRVFSRNAIIDPGVILMILERAGDSVVRVLIQDPQKLAEIILSSVGTQGIQTWSTVDLMKEIQVTPLDQQTHPHTHTPRLSHTFIHIFMFCLLIEMWGPVVS